MKTRTIAMANQKGGVGKTTTAVNVGAYLSRFGRRVLLIDLDPQANLTSWLGIDPRNQEPSLRDVFGGTAPIGELRKTCRLRQDLIPGCLELSGVEFLVADQVGRELILKKAMAGFRQEYDYVLVDCPPSLGLLTVNALVFVDEVFVPVQTRAIALSGLVTLLDTIRVVRERLNPKLELTGIIACMFDVRTNLSKEVVAKIRERFGEKVFKTVIRENVRLAEAPSFEKSIELYAPDSHGAEDYRALTREIMRQETVRISA